MGGTYDPLERNDDQDDDLKAGEEVSFIPPRGYGFETHVSQR